MNITPDALLGRATALAAALALAGCAAQRAGPSPAATAAPPSGPFYGLETATGGNAAGSATGSGTGPAGQAPGCDMLRNMPPEQRRRHQDTMRHCP